MPVVNDAFHIVGMERRYALRAIRGLEAYHTELACSDFSCSPMKRPACELAKTIHEIRKAVRVTQEEEQFCL